MSTLPLNGIRVLDLSTWWAGPLAGMLLADLGSDVVKVESIQRPDDWRGILAAFDDPQPYETSSCFNSVQRNKRGITVNLLDPRGVAIFKNLVSTADVVLENFSPRVMGQFGLDFGVLRKLNPAIIMVSMKGFGSDGPWRDFISYAQVAESLSGLSALTGRAEGSPVITGQMIADTLAGLHGAFATLIAIKHRFRTGLGQQVDLSQLECAAIMMTDAYLAPRLGVAPWRRIGDKHRRFAPHGCYPCAGTDEWIAIAIRSEVEWRALCRLIGRADWVADERFTSSLERHRHQDALDPDIADWTSRYEKHALAAELQAAGVPAAAVQSPRDLLSDAHLRERQFFQTVTRAVVGSLPYPTAGIRFAHRPLPIRRPAPLLGEHNRDVLFDLLGMSDQAIDMLRASDVIGCEPLARRREPVQQRQEG